MAFLKQTTINMSNSIFTKDELTARKIDVAFMHKQVMSVLNSKNYTGAICINQMPRDDTQLFTVSEASEIIANVIDDTFYHAL